MFSTPEFWVFIAFVLLIASFGKRVYIFVTQNLDEHSRKVADQLAKAESLQEEALSLLNSYKKKHEEALEQAKNIIAFAEREAQELKQASERDLEKFIAQKEKAFEERMIIEREELKANLISEATDEALKIVESALASSPTKLKKLTEDSLKKVATLKL